MATYKNLKTTGGDKIQVESAIRDGAGKNIENNYAKQNGYYAGMATGFSDQTKQIYSDRQIENAGTACPPITFGVTGGGTEIQSGYGAFERLEGKSVVVSGAILSAKSASLISTGKNQCCGLNEFIRVLPDTEYELSGITAGGYIEEYDANKNLIQTSTEITSATDITLTANTCYVKIQAAAYGNVMFYNTFCGAEPDSGVYGEPYEEYMTDTVELPNIELRSVGNIKDVAYRNGGGKRYVGYVDLGSLTWIAWGTNTTGKYRMLAALPAPAKSVGSSKIAKMLCPRYTSKSMDTVYSCVDGSRGITDISGNSYIGIYDENYSSNSDVSAFKTSMSGVYLCYELASPTDIPVSENAGWKEYVKVDNFGTLEFTANPTQIPQIEQPYFIKYTVNLVEFLDSAYVKAGGDADALAKKEDVLGVSGTVTIAVADWDNGEATKAFAALGNYDMITFSPSTSTDKTNAANADIFVSASGSAVTFSATNTPNADITFNYFITRGKAQ